MTNKAPWFLLAMEALAGAATVFASQALAHGDASALKPAVGGWQWLMLLAAIVGVTLLILRKIRSRQFLEALFGIAFFFGTWFLCLAFVPWPWASFLAVAIAASATVTHRVALHNLFVLLGCIGVAVNFAARFDTQALLAFLVAMALYDLIVAGPKGVLVEFVERLVRWRIAPGIVAPSTWFGWRQTVSASLASGGALLGSGDLVVPFMLVARVAFTNPFAAALLALGALFGLSLLLVRLSDRPRPALPWLAAGLAIPYAVLWAARIVA